MSFQAKKDFAYTEWAFIQDIISNSQILDMYVW